MTTFSKSLTMEAYKALTDKSLRKVALIGERGIGKTWMAKNLSCRAITEGVYDIVIWVFLCVKYDEKALSECIFRQLSFPHDDLLDANHGKTKINELEEMNDRIRNNLEGKSVILILDDEGCKMKEADIMPKIKLLLPSHDSIKILVTTSNSSESSDGYKIKMQPFDVDESLIWLCERIESATTETYILDILTKYISTKSRNFPREIMVIEKALNYFGRSVSGMRILESAIEEALETENYNFQNIFFSTLPDDVLTDCYRSGPHFFRDRGSVHYNELITYWILEGYIGQGLSIEDAYEKGHDVLTELLDCQILTPLESGFVSFPEGDDFWQRCGFGKTSSLGLATVLSTKWNGLGRITHEGGTIKTTLISNSSQSLSTLLISGEDCGSVPQTQNELKLLGLFNPSLRSPPSYLSKMTNLSILVLRGCIFMEDFNVTLHFRHLQALEISGAGLVKIMPGDFFENVTRLRILNLSGMGISFLPPSLYGLSELRWLVIRGCSSLERFESLDKLTNLVLLDLSGATSLKSISDKSFSKLQKLQTINLSGTKIQSLPILTYLGQLTHLLLSGCTNLVQLRSITALTSLRVLDISGATKVNEFHNRSLEKLSRLDILDLSQTSLDYLPLSLGQNLHSLYLKRCLLLTKLSCIQGLTGLKVLDLTGSAGLDEIEEYFFEYMTSLQVLNLSETNLREIPSILNLYNLRQLLLSRCVSLEKLPKLTSLEKLEVLDASGCRTLTGIHDDSFEHMFRLQRLDLSATKIQLLPPLSNPSKLRYLVLGKCTELKLLPSLKSVAKLEELNLSGVNGFSSTEADFVQDMRCLRILDLSDTDIEHIPSLSNLKNLSDLSLEGCKSIKTVPNLDALVKLEAINLSGTAVTHLPDLRSFPNLRELQLRGCSNLKEDTVKEIYDAISELTCLEMFEPPNMIATQNSRVSQKESNQQHPWIISNWHASAEKLVLDSHEVEIFVNGSQFLESLEENPLPRGFTKFHFLVHPAEAHDISAYMHFYMSELVLRDNFFLGLTHYPMVRERSLEIRGFSTFPEGIVSILGHVQSVYLIENPFLESLSNLGLDNIKQVKACWIERCRKMESVIHVEEETAADFGDFLEIMWISHLISLKNICSGNLRSNVFKNLKCLHLECCSEISYLFHPSQQLHNLEVLRIKFCDKLERLFVDESSSTDADILQNLKCFHIDNCPRISNVFRSSQKLHNLEALRIRCCDELESLFSSSDDDALLFPGLQRLNLWALPCLKKVKFLTPALRSLEVGECPMLVKILSSLDHPLSSLQKIYIQSCSLLETVIETSATTRSHVLRNLTSVHMVDLPELKSIGVQLLPLQDRNIQACPKLELLPYDKEKDRLVEL